MGSKGRSSIVGNLFCTAGFNYHYEEARHLDRVGLIWIVMVVVSAAANKLENTHEERISRGDDVLNPCQPRGFAGQWVRSSTPEGTSPNTQNHDTPKS